MPAATELTSSRLSALATEIKRRGRALGFQQIGIAGIDLHEDEHRLCEWLSRGRHGSMHYMARHGARRARPAELVPGTVRVISARMDYLAAEAVPAAEILAEPSQAFVSRYALGRDYHKVLRRRLQRLADAIEQLAGPFGHRVFVDSAPVLEKALARNAGLGWIGKHTNLINRSAGSYFFLGELFTDLPLPVDTPATDHCGTCRACIDICPTQAIVAPYQLDARRCISYLTIELRGSIPEPLRAPIGNRIFGCDDCQIVCPWNKFAGTSTLPDFNVRSGLDSAALVELFSWDEATWETRTAGSALRRPGYEGWLRNIAVALGNSAGGSHVEAALTARVDHPSPLVREHVAWALQQLGKQRRAVDGPSM